MSQEPDKDTINATYDCNLLAAVIWARSSQRGRLSLESIHSLIATTIWQGSIPPNIGGCPEQISQIKKKKKKSRGITETLLRRMTRTSPWLKNDFSKTCQVSLSGGQIRTSSYRIMEKQRAMNQSLSAIRMPQIMGVSVGLTCGYYFAVGQRACDYLPRSVVGGGVQPRAGLDAGVCTYSGF